MFRKNRLFGIGPCYFFDGGEGGDGGGAGTGGATGNEGGAGNEGGEGGDGGSTFNFDEFKSSFGKDYLDKPYMKDFDTPENMFRQIDNLQGLVGKKTALPGANATDKDWDVYREQIGVKDVNAYEFGDSHLPDNLKNLHAGEFEGKVKDLFLKAALSPEQAKVISEGYDKLMIDTHGELLNEAANKQNMQKVSDAEFNSMADKMWGGERETVQNVAKALINEFTPDEMRPHLENMSNENLVVLASVLKGVSDKYISQDDLAGMKGGSANGAMTLDTLRAQGQEELTKLTSMSPFDKGYAAQKTKVDELYSQIGRLSGDK